MFVTNQFTPEALVDRKKAFNNAAGKFDLQNTSQEFTNALEELESLLTELQTRGMFERPSETRTKIYGNNDRDEQEYRAEDALEAQTARLMIARHGLKILQRTIPFLTEIGNRCLEVAGKEAVRSACAPTPREGTDYHGNPLKPIPGEFTLPPGYEPSLVSKVKDALKR
jgi:hypothetical protein